MILKVVPLLIFVEKLYFEAFREDYSSTFYYKSFLRLDVSAKTL